MHDRSLLLFHKLRSMKSEYVLCALISSGRVVHPQSRILFIRLEVRRRHHCDCGLHPFGSDAPRKTKFAT